MGQQTTTIATVGFYRQDEKPPSAADGATWVTPSDGAGDDTASRYVYNAAADAWELDSAVGPSEPSDGTPVAGATWRDTDTSAAKQYNGTSFVSLGTQYKGEYVTGTYYRSATAGYNFEFSRVYIRDSETSDTTGIDFTNLPWTPEERDILTCVNKLSPDSNYRLHLRAYKP